MNFKMVYEFDNQHYFIGPTMIPVDRELSANQTEVAPNSENDNYFTGTAWIHKEKPTQEQLLMMKQQAQINQLTATNKQLQRMVMTQQAQIMELQKGAD